jgi:hypothetical protein
MSEVEYEATAGHSHYSITRPDILQHGNQFYLFLRSEDLALHTATVTLGPILIDLSPPFINGSLQIEERQGYVVVSWDEDTVMEDEGAGPVDIYYAIGTSVCV